MHCLSVGKTIFAKKRKMRILRFITILLLALSSNAVYSAEPKYKFLWGVDANTVFDNREGDQTYAPQQTIFFSRLSPTVGIQFRGGNSKELKDVHKLVAGTHYIQPIGIGYKETKFVPTAYYTFSHTVGCDTAIAKNDTIVYSHSKKWQVSFGMIPRRLMNLGLPQILWSDSMDYYNPNIRGILLQYNKNSKVCHELSLDWRSLQSLEQREAFNVNYCFERRSNNPFYFGACAQLNHLAKRDSAPEDEGVNDDMFLNPYVGMDFTKMFDKKIFDSFYLKAGYAVSFDRCRAIGDWEVDGGLLAEFNLLWRKIGIIESFYVGDRQYPLYPLFGSLLNMGDPHYQSSLYAKTTIYSPIVCNEHGSFGVYLDFHTTKEGTSSYQRVVLKLYLGNVDN